MQNDVEEQAPDSPPRRLSKADRRQQLLHTALQMVREEDADRLTLGNLALRAGVSKPVVYDHFATRSALLIALYTWIDTERVNAFRDAMAATPQTLAETAHALAGAYITCAAETTDEFYAIGAALAGSGEKAAVFQELLDNCVHMFVAVLKPHTTTSAEELERCCIGLVGAGEALAGAPLRGRSSIDQVIEAFAMLIKGALRGLNERGEMAGG